MNGNERFGYNELYHVGVPGMRWGHKTAVSKVQATQPVKTKRKIRDISDAELRTKINRMQMEQQYSQLSKNKVQTGKSYMKSVFKAGTTIAAVSTTLLTLYGNANKIMDVANKIKK